ncbi:hypothetical protein [Sutcliffiella horikoshii]|uniref:hypothetical protein n=1 Tax=Sutcliffiella horikoshii TaxID=79883 RepID=UPI003CED751D
MNQWLLLFTSIVVFLGIIASLWATNFKEEKRHKQLWFPFLGVLFALAVLRIDYVLSNPYINMAYERFPFLEGAVLLFLNMVILLLFLGLKMAAKTVEVTGSWVVAKFSGINRFSRGSRNSLFVTLVQRLPENIRKRLIVKNGGSRTVAIAYHDDKRSITLKPEWFYPRNVFVFISFLPAFILCLYIAGIVYGRIDVVQPFLPTYPALSLIVILECAWFLGGKRPKLRQETFEGENSKSRLNSKYKDLFHVYQDMWPERILTQGHIETQTASTPSFALLGKDPALGEVEKQFTEILQRLQKRNIPLRASHMDFLKNILQEKDVLLEDPVYDEISPFLFPAITSMLVKNKKIVVLTKDKQSAEHAVDWIEDGIKRSSGIDFLWKVATLNQTIEENIETNILVLAPENLMERGVYDYFEHANGTAEFEAVLMIEAERIIMEYGMLVHTFTLRLEDYLQKELQYIVLSQWGEGLETSLRKITKANIYDTLATVPKSRNFYYIVWRQEGKEHFQKRLFPKLTHRVIEPEAVLATIALKYNIEKISYLYQDKNPVSESIDELIDNPNHLRELYISGDYIDSFQKRSHYYKNYWEVPREEQGLFLVRDSNYNLIDTISQCWSNAKDELFVHIISPPYLLRDYLAGTAEFYLDNNRKVSPLAPRLSKRNWGAALFLLERMSHTHIPEQEVKSFLRSADIQEPIVMEGINRFFQQHFGAEEDYRHAIEVKKDRSFHSKSKSFEETVSYKFAVRVREMLTKNSYDFFEFKTHTGKIIGSVFSGHLFQQYLPGQLLTLDGQLFRMNEFNEEMKQVDVSFQSLTGKPLYRQNQVYTIGDLVGVTDIKQVGPYEQVFQTGETVVDVVTEGYFKFQNDINFDDAFYSYQTLTEKQKQQARRIYPNGKVLKVSLRHRQGLFAIENKEKIAFTLAFLLNETFFSLFPSSHMYVKATTKLSEGFNDTHKEDEELFDGLFPTLKVEHKNEEAVELYFIEDSTLQLGLLASIQENWEHILEIVDDYLAWLLEDPLNHAAFLKMGAPDVPHAFALEETSNLIRTLLPAGCLRELRQGNHKPVILNDEGIEKIECDYCAKEYYSTDFEEVDEGLNRCSYCTQTAITEVSQVEAIYPEIRQYFVNSFGIELRRDINMKLHSAKKLHELSGIPFVPTTKYNPRIVGRATMDEDKNMSVYIEMGAPRVQIAITLAHELTHVWQFDNLNMQYMTIQEIEGFASWIEVHYARSIDEKEYADKIHDSLMRRNDVYGQGYRDLVAMMEKDGRLESPFGVYMVKG